MNSKENTSVIEPIKSQPGGYAETVRSIFSGSCSRL